MEEMRREVLRFTVQWDVSPRSAFVIEAWVFTSFSAPSDLPLHPASILLVLVLVLVQ